MLHYLLSSEWYVQHKGITNAKHSDLGSQWCLMLSYEWTLSSYIRNEKKKMRLNLQQSDQSFNESSRGTDWTWE